MQADRQSSQRWRLIVLVGGLGLLALLVWARLPSDRDPAPSTTGPESATATDPRPEPVAEEPPPDDAEAPSPPAEPAVEAAPPSQSPPLRRPRRLDRLRVRYDHGYAAAGRPYWLWRDAVPEWLRFRVPEGQSVGHPYQYATDGLDSPRFGKPDGVTKARGEIRLRGGMIPAAVTVAIGDGLLASYRLDRSAPEDGVLFLPRFGWVTASVQTETWQELWEPGKWRVRLRSERSDADHVLLAVPTRGMTCYASLLSVPRIAAVAGEQTLFALPNERYLLEAEGLGFELRPPRLQVTEHDRVSFSIRRSHAAVEVAVVERPGEKAHPIDGRIVYRQRFHEQARGTTDIRKGIGLLGWAPFVVHATYDLWIVLEDGERFTESFTVPAEPTSQRVELVRGRGVQPLRVRLPERVRPDEIQSVVLETMHGELQVAPDLHGPPWLAPDKPVWRLEGRDTLVVANVPEAWPQLWVIFRTGRVAHAASMGSAASVRAVWLPAEPAEPVDPVRWFQEQHRSLPAAERPKRGEVRLEVLLRGRVRDRWVTVDRHRERQHDPLRERRRDRTWRKLHATDLEYRMSARSDR